MGKIKDRGESLGKARYFCVSGAPLKRMPRRQPAPTFMFQPGGSGNSSGPREKVAGPGCGGLDGERDAVHSFEILG